jgi:protein-S-isoprenylcysteine O-methyltransferase Ste14
MTVQQTTSCAWIIWYATWLAAVVFSAQTKVQNGADVRSPGRIWMGFGLISTFMPTSFWLGLAGTSPLAAFARPLWREPSTIEWALFGLTLTGFAFCWWARAHLGRLWSGFTTLKEDHRIIDSGPYALVRHPIYSGIIFSSLMTTLLNANAVSFLGWVSLIVGIVMIAKLEEHFLRQQLDAQAYDDYSRRVPMLVPGLPGVRGQSRG